MPYENSDVSLAGSQPHSFLYLLSKTTFVRRSELSNRNGDHVAQRPGVVTMWAFTEEISQPPS